MRMVLFQRTSASCASCARFHTKKIWKFGNTLNFKRTKQTKQNKTANMRLPLSSSWILQCLVNIRRPRPMQGGARQGKRVLLPLFTTATMGSEQKQVYGFCSSSSLFSRFQKGRFGVVWHPFLSFHCHAVLLFARV